MWSSSPPEVTTCFPYLDDKPTARSNGTHTEFELPCYMANFIENIPTPLTEGEALVIYKLDRDNQSLTCGHSCRIAGGTGVVQDDLTMCQKMLPRQCFEALGRLVQDVRRLVLPEHGGQR